MIRFLSISILTLFILASCLSPETKRELDLREKAVATLTQELKAAEASGSEEIEVLNEQLKAAQGELDKIKGEALRERIASGAGMVEQGAKAGQPITTMLFPAATFILAIVGELAGAIKGRYSTEEKA